MKVVNRLFAATVLLPYAAITQLTNCPNFCSGNGLCSSSSSGSCQCYPGFHGVDCSIRLCPSGIAWVDFPTAVNVAHANFTECSNMGICNRATGVCACRRGFGGPACESVLCGYSYQSAQSSCTGYFCSQQALCSGHGRCMSLREASLNQIFNYLAPYEYSNWDADMIHGCVCDSGWQGYSCEKRACPKGDDPATPGLDEIQLLECSCRVCTGAVTISFRGDTTLPVAIDATAAVIKDRLERLDTIDNVHVEIKKGSTLCSRSGSTVSITIRVPQGPQPPIQVTKLGGLQGEVYISSGGESSKFSVGLSSVASTKEYVECSNHGKCNRNTGFCECYGPFQSSNGMSASGTIGDCGFQFDNGIIYNGALLTACPFVLDQICSGNGDCNEDRGKCVCDLGYDGLACNEIFCGSSNTWFGDTGLGHEKQSICGGVGSCDTSIGACVCGDSSEAVVYGGETCNYLTCDTGVKGALCSGNGRCLTMRELAKGAYNSDKELANLNYTDAWDADMIKGCLCGRSPTVDGQFQIDYRNNTDEYPERQSTFYFDSTYSEDAVYANYSHIFSIEKERLQFYRGPYAYAVSDFKSYKCQQALCPKGDNPRYRSGANEVQKLTCRLTSGSFYLTFRENTTMPIAAHATLALLKRRLEQLYTIREVGLTVIGNETDTPHHRVCGDNTSVLIEFQTELGDLPLLKAAPSTLVSIVEYRKGTRMDVECSGQGICNEDTGVCSCVDGFRSSNSSLDFPGDTGDCSFFNSYPVLSSV